MVLWISGCDLERIEPGGGSKFNSTFGGNGSEVPFDILVNSDGTYIIVGESSTFTGPNNTQAYIAKISAQGELLDQNNFGGSKNDRATSVVAVGDGSYVFTGYKTHPASGSPDIYIVKVDANLDSIWTQTFGKTDSTEYAGGIIKFGSSGFLVGYEVTDQFDFFSSIRFLEINANGNKVKDKLGRSAFTGDYFGINQMIKTSDGSIVIVGAGNFLGDLAPYMAKFDSQGAFIWDQIYQNQASTFTRGRGVVEMSDKSLVLVGSGLGPGTSDHDFLMVKYSGIGMFQLDTIWGGANADELLAVTRSQDDNVVVLGYTTSISSTSELYLSKRNRNTGVEIWARHFNQGGDSPAVVRLCSDGGFILCTATVETPSDIQIIKTDSNGEYE